MKTKLHALIGNYFHRIDNKKYIAINQRFQHLDMDGYLSTSRGVYQFREFSNKHELKRFLKEDVAKNDRNDWAVYIKLSAVEKQGGQL